MSSGPKILLVEGEDDKHVVQHLQMLHLSHVTFDVEDKHGIDKLIKAIVPEIMVSGRVAIGILADANGDPKGRWKDVSDQLRRAGIKIPAAPVKGGAIINSSGGLPRVGIWLMPDNCSTGELEDFIKHMLPCADPVWPLAEKYIRDIPADARRFASRKTSKAEIYAWLAAREKPGRMGAAIGRGDLQTGGSLCADFLKWIGDLFK